MNAERESTPEPQDSPAGQTGDYTRGGSSMGGGSNMATDEASESEKDERKRVIDEINDEGPSTDSAGVPKTSAEEQPQTSTSTQTSSAGS